MSKHIPKNNKLLVISDTTLFIDKEDKKGFAPVVSELNTLLKVFEEITWIGFENKSENNNNSLAFINTKKINVISLKKVGGERMADKLKIILYYPKMFFIITKQVLKHKYIHSRAPSNPSVIAMLLSLFFVKKHFWHKYAGNWKGKASFFYKVQREILKRLLNNSLVTVNGEWNEKNKNIKAFENPCLTEEDRIKGSEVIKTKNISEQIQLCFVGGLNENKGLKTLILALNELDSAAIEKLHVVGDGPLKAELETLATQCKTPIIFYGFLSKNQLVDIYKASHFIVLPSKSEGFPKVIGEAMNYGCIPMVSDVSCIGQYIQNNYNGFLINPLTPQEIKKQLIKGSKLSSLEFKDYISRNYKLSNKFTFTYFLNSIKKEILGA